MISSQYTLLVLLLLCVQGQGQEQLASLKANLESDTDVATQASEAKALIRRLIGQRSQDVNIEITGSSSSPASALVQSDPEGQVKIRATSGSMAAAAFNKYLKDYCECHVSWDLVQLDDLPKVWPSANFTLRATDLVRYYQNVCEYGYSFVWWKWNDWERHIDWMALNGFNLVLAEVGQEFIWWQTLTKFGMTSKQVLSHFTGPAFLPWNRMGNLFSWAGPLPLSWLEQSRLLQHQILNRIRNLGMIPVIPAFNGIVPKVIADLNPEVGYTRLRQWGHFNANFTGSFLPNITSTLVHDLGKSFLSSYIAEFGTNHFYSLDTFNEQPPPESSSVYLSSYAEAMTLILNQVDSKAVWVMQGWMFRYDKFWNYQQAKDLLTSIPVGKLLILDLTSTTNPEFTRLDSYFGHPFVYCMLHNYGGTLGLYGKASEVNQGPYWARSLENSTMIGTGITPEGLYNSYVMYDLFFEAAWRQTPLANLSGWSQSFARRRYGASIGGQSEVTLAWPLLIRSSFNCCHGQDFRFHGQSALTTLPSLKLKQILWYDPEEVDQAWTLMTRITAPDDLDCSHPFAYDLVDISRQAMTNKLYRLYDKVIKACKASNVKAFDKAGQLFLDLVVDIDSLLGSCQGFMLGPWLEAAKAKATNEYEAMAFEYNARNQITLWGPEGNILDYAAKQWSGLIATYYQPRWSLFFKDLRKSMILKKKFDEKLFKRRFLKTIGTPFTLSRRSFPSKAVGRPLALAKMMREKWCNINHY